MSEHHFNTIETLAKHIVNNAADKPRYIFAIAGAPGSGKSTAAHALQQLITEKYQRACQIIAMDGFHLDNQVLIEQGLLEVKGAPQTFDLVGFERLLTDLQVNQTPIQAPIFDRNIDAVIENAIYINTATQIILVEGNYLLLKQFGWQKLAQYFDSSVYLQVPIEVLRERLVERWINQDLDIDIAVEKAQSNDLPNALLVINQSKAADITLSLKA